MTYTNEVVMVALGPSLTTVGEPKQLPQAHEELCKVDNAASKAKASQRTGHTHAQQIPAGFSVTEPLPLPM